jgi:hypothetical protein
MTKYRWKPEQTTRDRIARTDMYRGKNADERDDNARRRAGIRAHIVDPTDPWSAVTWQACEPSCTQHTQGRDAA